MDPSGDVALRVEDRIKELQEGEGGGRSSAKASYFAPEGGQKLYPICGGGGGDSLELCPAIRRVGGWGRYERR